MMRRCRWPVRALLVTAARHPSSAASYSSSGASDSNGERHCGHGGRGREEEKGPSTDKVCGALESEGAGPEERDRVILAAADRLRSAIQALSEVELKKAKSAAVAATQAQRDRLRDKVPKPAVTASAQSSSLLKQPSAATSTPTPTTAATATAGATSSTSPSWIRDKTPKFWKGIVYTDHSAGAVPERKMPSTPSSSPAASSKGDASSVPSMPTTPASGSSRPPEAATGVQQQQQQQLQQLQQQAVASVRVPTRDPIRPFRNRYKRDVARRLSQLLDCDPNFGPVLLEQLSAESRRLLLVMATASEYYGEDYEELAEQVKAADKDKDNAISGQEFEQWARSSFKKRQTSHRGGSAARSASGSSGPGAEGIAATAAAASATAAGGPRKENPILKAIQKHPDKAKADFAATSSPTSAPTPSPAGNLATAEAPPASTLPPPHGAPSQPATAPTGPPSTTSQYASSLWQGAVNAVLRALPGALGGVFRRRGDDGGQEAKKKEGGGGDPTQDPSYIPWPTYGKLVLAAAAPFMAFGFLDNSTLVLAGDAVDRYVSEYMSLSEMAAAAVGGVVSGVAGIQVHGLAERWTRSTPPKLTPAQSRSRHLMSAERAGNTAGMVVGLILGMTPLLFIGAGTEEEVQEDHQMLQKEVDRTRQQRRQRSDVGRAETKERGLVEFEEKENRKTIVKHFTPAADPEVRGGAPRG